MQRGLHTFHAQSRTPSTASKAVPPPPSPTVTLVSALDNGDGTISVTFSAPVLDADFPPFPGFGSSIYFAIVDSLGISYFDIGHSVDITSTIFTFFMPGTYIPATGGNVYLTNQPSYVKPHQTAGF